MPTACVLAALLRLPQCEQAAPRQKHSCWAVQLGEESPDNLEVSPNCHCVLALSASFHPTPLLQHQSHHPYSPPCQCRCTDTLAERSTRRPAGRPTDRSSPFPA